MLGLSAVAVESEMVGRDSEAELIGGGAVVDSGFPPAERSAACALGTSVFDLGGVENSWVRRLALDVEALVGRPPFSEDDEKDGGLEGGELLVKGFVGRRGIAED
jgi:hypothetical protein